MDKYIILFIAILITSCSKTPIPPTPMSILDAQNTALVQVQTQAATTRLAALALTPSPTNTPIITRMPLPTYTPQPTGTATTPPLYEMKGDGYYLIGKDIAPGVWRSNGTANDCYWEITTQTGEIINNHFGMAGGTAYIPSNGFQVQFKHCGNWEYLQGP